MICGHLRDDHRHYNTLWKEVEEDEKVVDKAAEKKYNEAKTEKEKKESMKQDKLAEAKDWKRNGTLMYAVCGGITPTLKIAFR